MPRSISKKSGRGSVDDLLGQAPPPAPSTDPRETLRLALEIRAAARSNVEQLRSKASRARADGLATAAQIERLARTHADRAAEAYVNGDPPPDVSRSDRDKLKKLRERGSAVEQSKPLFDAKIAEAQSLALAVELRCVEAFFDWKAERQEGLLELVSAALTDLQAPLAELVAIGSVQGELIGSQFTMGMPNHPGLFAGAAQAMKLVKGVPEGLRPPGLQEDDFGKACRAHAAALLSILQDSNR